MPEKRPRPAPDPGKAPQKTPSPSGNPGKHDDDLAGNHRHPSREQKIGDVQNESNITGDDPFDEVNNRYD